jgi:lipoprotein-anchoring transpeptidase ErfK/SrfK
MTPERRFLLRPARRIPIILLLTVVFLIALASVAWAAWGSNWPVWRGLLSIAPTAATATPTRTPRPEPATPTPAPVDLAIIVPTATSAPTQAPSTPTAVPVATSEPLIPHLIEVVERYGMDMARRFVVVDLAGQIMLVWDPGRPTRVIPVSTGDETRGYRTLAWYGLIGDYWGTFQASGVYADEGWYLFEDAGHILIHGAPYKLVNGEKVYEDMDALGAYPASKGCIRIAPEDATWFTNWNPKGVPIVILPKDESLGIN